MNGALARNLPLDFIINFVSTYKRGKLIDTENVEKHIYTMTRRGAESFYSFFARMIIMRRRINKPQMAVEPIARSSIFASKPDLQNRDIPLLLDAAAFVTSPNLLPALCNRLVVESTRASVSSNRSTCKSNSSPICIPSCFWRAMDSARRSKCASWSVFAI